MLHCGFVNCASPVDTACFVTGVGFRQWIWHFKNLSFSVLTASVAQVTVFWLLTTRVMTLFRLFGETYGWLNLIHSPEDVSPEPFSFTPEREVVPSSETLTLPYYPIKHKCPEDYHVSNITVQPGRRHAHTSLGAYPASSLVKLCLMKYMNTTYVQEFVFHNKLHGAETFLRS